MKKRIEQIIKLLRELLPKPKPVPAKPAPKPVAKPFTMYDSTDVSMIPKSAKAVGCYLTGALIPGTCVEVHKKFRYAKVLSIAVTAEQDAMCLDVERGDATPSQVPDWVRRQQLRGVYKPWIYADLNTMPAVKFCLAQAKIKRTEVHLWVAHYTGTPHIEKGYDATQYTDKALGRNLDASLCLPTFLP